MKQIREAIVVEGKYDAIRVRSVVDATVVQTDGFRIFSSPEKRELLRRLAETRGLIILTDSDTAGGVIRSHLLGFLPREQIKIAYVPPTPGKEKRKPAPSKEGLLGVEGIDGDTVLAALERAGATFTDGTAAPDGAPELTKADLYALGLSGHPDSAARRREILRRLRLPEYLSANRLLDVLNTALSPEERAALLAEAETEQK